MRAIGVRSFGGAERLELLDVAVPQIGPQEVLVKVVGHQSSGEPERHRRR